MMDKQAVEMLRAWVVSFRRYRGEAVIHVLRAEGFCVCLGWYRRRRGISAPCPHFVASGMGKTLGEATENAWRSAMNHPAHPSRRLRKET